jgi:hypothetical protein
MKLLPIILEYIYDDAELLIYHNFNDVEIEVWESPHTKELRDGKKRVPERKMLLDLIITSLPSIINTLFSSGRPKYRPIKMDDQNKFRFTVRNIVGESRPQAILQVEELNNNKLVLNVITFMNTGKDIFGIKNTNKSKFILDLGEKDLDNK